MLKRQKGFGIAELLVGIAVGMIIVAAAMQLLQTTLTNSNDNIKMARLEQELRQTMQMVSRDLRRATTWDAATDVAQVSLTIPLTLSANSGTATVSTSASDTTGINHLADVGSKAIGGTLIHIDSAGTVYQGSITAYSSGTYTVTLTGTWPTTVTATDGISKGSWNILRPESTLTASSTCVLFIYDFDTDDDGAYDVGRYGYRLNSSAVQVRTSGANTDTCSSGGTWENITDPNVVQVTAFSVTDNSPAAVSSSGLNVSIREYTISITGQLASDSDVSRTFQETIKVRNDRLS